MEGVFQSIIYIWQRKIKVKKKEHRNWEREKGTLPESRHAFDVSIHRIKLLAMEMFKVYDNMAHEYLCQFCWKMRSTLDPRAPLLDFSCLFPKPIMATTRKKNILAIGAHLLRINYSKICVNAKPMNLFNSELGH